MIKQSPELAAVVSRWVSALQHKDRDAVSILFSSSEYLRYVGSDLNEVCSGNLVLTGYADHIEETPDSTITPSIIEAYECGDTGWVFCRGGLRVKGMADPFVERLALVFTLEAGTRKIVQAHIFLPTPNLEVIGVEHKAFDELIESARENYHPVKNAENTTVMFTDIVNSTSIAHAVGDRLWAVTIGRHQRRQKMHVTRTTAAKGITSAGP